MSKKGKKVQRQSLAVRQRQYEEAEEAMVVGGRVVKRWRSKVVTKMAAHDRALFRVKDLPMFVQILRRILDFWLTARLADASIDPIAQRLAITISFRAEMLRQAWVREHGTRISPCPRDLEDLWSWRFDAEQALCGERNDITGATPTLDEDEAKVLNYINEEYPQVRYRDDVVARACISAKTVGKILVKLREAGLVQRPEGKQRGNVITPAGREYIAKYFS